MDAKLVDIFVALFEIEPETLRQSTATNDVENWDSITHLSLVLSIEEGYGVAFTPNEIAEMTSVGAIEQILQLKRQAA